MANIKPLGQRVLVKRIEAETKTAGGLFLPDTAKEKPQEAEVISVGTGGRDEKGALIEFTVKPGDRVLISKYGGTEIKLDGEDYLILSENDILGNRRQGGLVRLAHRHSLGDKLPKYHLAAGKENKCNGQSDSVNGNHASQSQGDQKGSCQFRYKKRSQESQRQGRKRNARLAGGQIKIRMLGSLPRPGQFFPGSGRNTFPGVQLAFTNLHQGELACRKKRIQQQKKDKAGNCQHHPTQRRACTGRFSGPEGRKNTQRIRIIHSDSNNIFGEEGRDIARHFVITVFHKRPCPGAPAR